MSSAEHNRRSEQGASSPYVPLSVRFGGRREKFGWWMSTQRERVALRLAPWLKPHYGGYQADVAPRMLRCLCPRNIETGERLRTHNEWPVHSVPNWWGQP